MSKDLRWPATNEFAGKLAERQRGMLVKVRGSRLRDLGREFPPWRENGKGAILAGRPNGDRTVPAGSPSVAADREANGECADETVGPGHP